MAPGSGQGSGMEPPETRPAESVMADAMEMAIPTASGAPTPQEQLLRECLRGAVLSPYPPIADYAFLSDCEVTALVAPGGSIEWMCLPRMDGPSVFGAILDRDAGWFRL